MNKRFYKNGDSLFSQIALLSMVLMLGNSSGDALAVQFGPSVQDSPTHTVSNTGTSTHSNIAKSQESSQSGTAKVQSVSTSVQGQLPSDTGAIQAWSPVDSATILTAKPGTASKDSMRPLPHQNSSQAAATGTAQPSSGTLDSSWYRTIGSLAAVICIMYGVGLIIKRFSPITGLAGAIGPAGKAPSGVIEVLARYPAGKGMLLILLKVDRRILLVSQNQSRASATMTTLTEFSDVTEVASLIAKTATRSQTNELQAAAAGTSFRNTLGKAGVPTLAASNTTAATRNNQSLATTTRSTAKNRSTNVNALEDFKAPLVTAVQGFVNTPLAVESDITDTSEGDSQRPTLPTFPREGAARIAKAYKNSTAGSATMSVSRVVSQLQEADGATAATNLRQRLAMMRPASSQTPGSRPTAVREFEA